MGKVDYSFNDNLNGNWFAFTYPDSYNEIKRFLNTGYLTRKTHIFSVLINRIVNFAVLLILLHELFTSR